MELKPRRYILSIHSSRPDGRLIEEAFGHDRDDIDLLTLYSGDAALNHLRNPANRLPSLILLAARFPTLSALDILRAIKADKRLRGIPVLVLASYLPPQEAEELFAEGASSVIELPGNLEELENIVRLLKAYWLGIAGLPEQGRAASNGG
jgi:CheY-like chemotaxis protein